MGFKEKNAEEYFLNLLDRSPAIQKKIRQICSYQPESTDYREKTESLEATVRQLKNQLAEMQKYKQYSERLEEKCHKLETENNSLKYKLQDTEEDSERLEAENKRLKEIGQNLATSFKQTTHELESLQECFSESVILLKKYRTLSVSIRTGLSDVICDKDEVLFIASCTSPEHLKSIWSYTKRLANNNGDIDGIQVLNEIFDHFFDVFNNSLREPMYIRDNVEIGCLFDDDKHDRYTGSNTSGRITQVILKGYNSANTGKKICR